jgi:hypothetical protein
VSTNQVSIDIIRAAAAATAVGFDEELTELTERAAFRAWQTHVLAAELSASDAEQIRAKLRAGTHSQIREFRLTQLALYHDPPTSPAVLAAVAGARAAGASWAEIGAVCGFSDSAAGRKWRHLVRP